MSAPAGSPQENKLRIRRSIRLLQFAAMGSLFIGLACAATSMGTQWTLALGGVFAFMAGITGIVGLSFTWVRGLVIFTVMSWTVSLMSTISIMQ